MNEAAGVSKRMNSLETDERVRAKTGGTVIFFCSMCVDEMMEELSLARRKEEVKGGEGVSEKRTSV